VTLQRALAGAQVREARELLGWTRGRLSGAARFSASTIGRSPHKMTTEQFSFEGDDFEHNILPPFLRELKADQMKLVRTADRMSLHVGTREGIRRVERLNSEG
jgi:hypothetical protein